MGAFNTSGYLETVAKILLVEDDKQLGDMVRTALLFEHHSVEYFLDGKSASDHLLVSEYDMCILDWQMPGLSGIELMKEYRGRGGKAPILMLTGKGAISDKEVGFDAGADDYLTKPFHMKELVIRVRALLRRPSNLTEDVLTAASVTLDATKHRVLKDGKPVPLVPKEFALLEFLMRHPNQVFTPEALLHHVWPSDSEVTVLALRTTIKRLRNKIDPEGEILRTEHGVGYILEVD